MVRPVWIPYYGLFYTPHNYYGYEYWYGNYAVNYPSYRITSVESPVKRIVTKKQLTAPKSTKSGKKTKVKNK